MVGSGSQGAAESQFLAAFDDGEDHGVGEADDGGQERDAGEGEDRGLYLGFELGAQGGRVNGRLHAQGFRLVGVDDPGRLAGD